jgi:hypothetical protein
MKQHAEKCAFNKPVNVGEAQNECDCDGYHTYDELYGHRYALWMALCRKFLAHANSMGGRVVEPEKDWSVWRSRFHSDGTFIEGWFLLGIGKAKGEQITYHLPMSKWDETGFAETLQKAPEFDGHTSDDVLERLRSL